MAVIYRLFKFIFFCPLFSAELRVFFSVLVFVRPSLFRARGKNISKQPVYNLWTVNREAHQ